MKSQHKLLYLSVLCLLGVITYISGCSKVTPPIEEDKNPIYMNISVDGNSFSETIRVY